MTQQGDWCTVAVNLYRSADRITAAAPMPGVEPDDIRVEVLGDGRLILDGAPRGGFKGVNEVILCEWQAGGYHRELQLPAPVDGTLANITYGNGVLVVALPISVRTKSARLTPRSIGPTQGERVGNAGHPVRPLTDEQHHAAHGI
jgi:HSP20 family molecular chaperone IbpA